jgi:CBS domain-containing protein
MAENSCGAIPVIRSAGDRTPLGIVTDRDVAVRTVAEGRNPLELSAGDVMSRSPITIGPEEPLAACASLMRERQVRRIVVVDPRGCVRGLVVLAQIARHLPREISGETVKDISQPPQGGQGQP